MSLLERYASKIKGVLSCFDRVIVYGTLPGLCYAAGMTSYLKARGVRIFVSFRQACMRGTIAVE